MTLVYDSLGAPAQLGADLQQFSSSGWSTTDGLTHWDGGQNGTAINSYSFSYATLFVFQGVLHVTWVEPQWNGSVRLARGPYVAKWNGSSWVALGGEVDPAITPIDVNYPSPGFGSFEITDAVGTRWRPGRPRLVSDGTSLYCVYTVQEVVTAPASVHLPPNGVTAPGGSTVGVTHPWTVWAPRKVYVRKWNGTSWDLYGSLDALTFNDGQGAGAAPAPGTAAARNATASQGILLDVGASAHSSQLGVVYVAMMEQGVNSTLNYYTSAGTIFFAPNRCVLQTAKFDGSSTAGTVQQVIDNSTQVAFNSTLNFGFSANTTGQTITAVGESNVICRNVNGGFVFWYKSTNNGSVGGHRMTAIDTNVEKTAENSASLNTFPWLVVYQAARNKYLLQPAATNVECVTDGSDVAFTNLWNGDNVRAAYTQAWDAVAEGGLDDLNVWLGWNNSGNPNSIGDILLYHHNCFAVTDEQYPSGDLTHAQAVGYPSLAVIGNVLYAAGAWRDTTNVALDLKLRVYAMTISRGGGGSCAGNSPALTGSGSGSCSTATLNGTVNPNNAAGGVTVYFEYGPTTSYGTTATVGTVSGGSQAVTGTATGLTPGATYHFRVNLIAPDGSVVLGSDATFTEGVCPPGPYLHSYVELGVSVGAA